MEENNKKRILAMYDVRGKQEFIFRSNHLKEIMGGSAIIRDCFNYYLFMAAIIYRDKLEYKSIEDLKKSVAPRTTAIKNLDKSIELKKLEKQNQDNQTNVSEKTVLNDNKEQKENEEKQSQKSENLPPFDRCKFEEDMDNEAYLGEMIYNGGGDFYVLYKDKDTYITINKYFTKLLLEDTPTLKVLSAYIEGLNYDNYIEDERKLRINHERIETKNNPTLLSQTLPITEIDTNTSMPKEKFIYNEEGEYEKISRESSCKYNKYKNYCSKGSKDLCEEKLLDEIITEKGVESLLAIVYIDGNNMGAKKQECTQEFRGDNVQPKYEDYFEKLRSFSKSIKKEFVDDRKKDLENFYQEKYKNDVERKKKKRFVIYAGDEMQFICNVRDAFDLVKIYMDGLNTKEEKRSVCAGICIFHSHDPYSVAYSIAEECCESAKTFMKKNCISEGNYLDWQFCVSGFGTNLESMRKRENTFECSKPWCHSINNNENNAKEKEAISFEMIDEMKIELNKLSRTTVKNLSKFISEGKSKYLTEIERINAHVKDKDKIDFSLGKKLENIDDQMKLIYDMVTVYDYWFIENKEDSSNESESNTKD